MLSKTQKIWLWVSGAMFLIPEILFFTTPLLIQSLSGKSFLNLSSLFINYAIFFAHPLYLLLIIFFEWIGVLGLIILSIKLNKKILTTLSLIVLLWLSYAFCIVYITSISMGY